MGIIKKQALFNSIASYIGIAIGYINIVLIFPYVLTTEQFGLTRLILALATLHAQFSAFGTSNILLRFFPYFRNKQNGHKGFLFFVMTIALGGFTVLFLLAIIFKEQILHFYREESASFAFYYLHTLVLSLFVLSFSFLDSFLRALFITVLPGFLKDVLLRGIWLIEAILYHFDFFSFDVFMLLFIGAYGLLVLIELTYLINLKELIIKLDINLYKKKVSRVMLTYGFFNVINGISGLLVNRVDIIMLGAMVGLSDTGIYAVASYIGAIMVVPGHSIGKIAYPLITKSWKEKDMMTLKSIYYKSVINQSIIGVLFFIGIWVNLDNILALLSEEYRLAANVIIILSFGKLISMMCGVNALIIIGSKYYIFDTVSNIILVLLTIVTNYIFIPIYGMDGAAIASAVSLIISNLIYTGFIWNKLGFQPFDYKIFVVLLIGVITFFSSYFIPKIEPFILDAITRSIVVTSVFLFLVYIFRLSGDVNQSIEKLFFNIIKRDK